MISDIENLAKQFNPSLIHFTDNAISPAMLRSLSRSNLDIPWYGFVRVTSDLADPVFCKNLRQSGCVMLKLGIESGDQWVLDYMNKGIRLEYASSALKALKDAGIATYVYLLFGTPAEDISEAKNTLEFTANHIQFMDFLNLAIFNLPVNSPDTARLRTKKFYEGDLSLYTGFKHPRGWDRQKVRQFLENDFKKHPSIQTVLVNHPPFFTSNHAPFFKLEGFEKRQQNIRMVGP